MTDEELALQEFLKGLELFEASKTENKPVINKILYNKLNGVILKKITEEYTNTHPDLTLMNVDQTYIHDEDLIKNYYVQDGQVVRRTIERLNYSKKVLEQSETGRFTTVKNNMIFVADQGDCYEYKRN